MGQAIIGAAIGIMGGLTIYCILRKKRLLHLILTVILNGVCGAIMGLMCMANGILTLLVWLPIIGIFVAQTILVATLAHGKGWGLVSSFLTSVAELVVLLTMTFSLQSSADASFGIVATILALLATGELVYAFYLTYRGLNNLDGIVIKRR